MMPIYINTFEKIKSENPRNCSQIIKIYLDLIMEFYYNHPAMATVEILDNFQTYRNAPVAQAEFSDIYEKYGNTAFLTNNLSESDITYLKTRYMQSLIRLGKEYDCDI